MFRRWIGILSASFRTALQELGRNKLRTFLSLFGITIGIFCIIGVLATVNSLEHNIQNEISSLGNNTIYIDKWDYSAGSNPDFPRWKYARRPSPAFDEVRELKERTPSAAHIAFRIRSDANVEKGDAVLTGVTINAVSSEFNLVQPVDIAYGRYFSLAEMTSTSNVVVIGDAIATKLFGDPSLAPGKEIKARQRKMIVIGVIRKQGSQMIRGWDFDQVLLIPYVYGKTFINERFAEPLIIVKGKPGINSRLVKDELAVSMRAVRKLKPREEDNFSLNDVRDFSDTISKLFSGINLGGWAIAALSLIVGMFGVANIMFVTVRERTHQIGLKKAIGAKRGVILTEFLVESAFLCIIGGMMGLVLVFLLTKILTNALHFPVFVSGGYVALAIGICITVGIIAGFIPALQAARMNPVDAIRK